MIYVSAYNSPSLDDNSYIRFDESCITYIIISENDEDVSDGLNRQIHTIGPDRAYPTWEKLSLCLRTDWKRLNCWSLEGSMVLTEPLRRTFDNYFDTPLIVASVLGQLQAYAEYLHDTNIPSSVARSYGDHLYCINKEELRTLEWGFGIVDQFSDEEGLREFREAIVVGTIKDAIETIASIS